LSGKPSPAPDSRKPSAPSAWVPQPPGLLKRSFLRIGIGFFVGTYLRVRHEGFETLPDPPYLLSFSHPSWVDPFLLASHWPREHVLFIFGPKEEDMSTGFKNALIRWSHMAVPFRPSKTDLIDTTRRATSVLRAGYVLAVAGEGRLSDREGQIVPLQEGPAFFALRAGVPIVPMVIIGGRWLRFGKTLTMRVGPVVELDGRRADREGVESMTAAVQQAMEELLVGVEEDEPPGRFGRWLTDVLAERPWLLEQQADAAREAASDGGDAPPQAPQDERR
jgi:1-acyl-sn-glycerol-3-phosphate acyltransferase